MRLNRTGFMALVISSLGLLAPNSVQAALLPISGITVDVPGTVLNAVPPELQQAISTFYTSDLTRTTNPTVVSLESDDVGALERTFAQSPSKLLVMSRATYQDVTLLQWPIGTSESIVAIILPRARLAWLAYRKPSDTPFDGRKIARNLASTLSPKLYVKASDLATALGWKLVRPNAPNFEYQFQRPNATDPKALDRFNWSVPRLEAALTLGVPTGASAFLGVQASRVTLITPPARIGASGDPYLGLEVAQVLNDCSLEGLTTTQATYRCGSAGNPFTLNVTTNR